MKISEITDKNKVWSEMNNIDIIHLKNTYNFLLKSLQIIIKLKSPSRARLVLNNVNEFVSNIDKIVSIKYPDKNDEDVMKMKTELTEMKTHIINLSNQLRL